VSERVGDGEQQPVGRGERGGQTARRHQARYDIRQSGDLGSGKDDDVLADGDLGKLHDAVVVQVRYRQ